MIYFHGRDGGAKSDMHFRDSRGKKPEACTHTIAKMAFRVGIEPPLNYRLHELQSSVNSYLLSYQNELKMGSHAFVDWDKAHTETLTPVYIMD